MNSNQNIERRRIGVSLIASVLAHLLLVALIAVIQSNQPEAKKKEPQIMDVVLLDKKDKKQEKEAKNARTLSNQTARGGSKAQDRVTRQAQAPMSMPTPQPKPTPPSQPKAPTVPQQQNRTRMLAKRGEMPDTNKSKKRAQPAKKKPSEAPTPKLKMQNLLPSTMQMAHLSQRFEREQRMKQKMSREADIPINTKQAKYAPYARALVQALEEQWRPGQANYQEYPEDKRRALIKLTIERSGDLGGVEILRPSPIPEINDSAIRAIHAAAPFKVLPTSWGLDRVSFYLTFEVIEDRFVFRPM